MGILLLELHFNPAVITQISSTLSTQYIHTHFFLQLPYLATNAVTINLKKTHLFKKLLNYIYNCINIKLTRCNGHYLVGFCFPIHRKQFSWVELSWHKLSYSPPPPASHSGTCPIHCSSRRTFITPEEKHLCSIRHCWFSWGKRVFTISVVQL